MTDNLIVKDIIVKVVQAPGFVARVRDSSVLASPGEIGAYTKEQVDQLLAADKALANAAIEGVRTQTEELAFQFATPALTWVIPHNLGRKRPAITIVDTAGDEILTSIRPQDANTAIATFDAPTAGTAFVN